LTTQLDTEFWTLAVADNGVGIRREALPWIFEAFRQADRDKMEQQGAGLGLAVVRALAGVHGGRVEVVSELGKGSRFTVYLPVAI
jgi:two-component system heavy metal sensor histidine kinase CusS